jgi:hypothetical protein
VNPTPLGQLALYLVDGGFQVAQAHSKLQPPQEVVGRSDQDVKLLVHQAVQGGGFIQMAPGRRSGIRKALNALPSPPPTVLLPRTACLPVCGASWVSSY